MWFQIKQKIDTRLNVCKVIRCLSTQFALTGAELLDIKQIGRKMRRIRFQNKVNKCRKELIGSQFSISDEIRQQIVKNFAALQHIPQFIMRTNGVIHYNQFLRGFNEVRKRIKINFDVQVLMSDPIQLFDARVEAVVLVFVLILCKEQIVERLHQKKSDFRVKVLDFHLTC